MLGVRQLSLSRVTDVSILVVCAVLLATLARNELDHHRKARDANHRASTMVGQKVAGMPTSSRRRVAVTLVLSPTCPYCAKSVPFYRDLTRLARESGGLMVVTSKAPHGMSLDEFFRDNQLEGVVPLVADDSSLSVSAVPTLLVSDADDRIAQGWTGYLGEDGRRDVYALISKMCPACRTALDTPSR